MYDDTVMVDKAYYNKLKEQTTWISVKDRLPEMDVEVLVYTELKNTFIASWVVGKAWEDDYGFFLTEDVTHWRPLPEPPKEENETPDDIYFDEHNELRDEQEVEEDLYGGDASEE